MVSRQFHSLKVAGSIPALATILLASALWLSGCTTTHVRTRPTPLPLPAHPVLPPVPASSVACLSDATYTTLVKRERALRTWGLKLEGIIRANNQHAHDKVKR